MRAALVLLLVLVGAVAGATLGDELDQQIAALSRTLERDPSEKARIAAAVALGRLSDARTLATFQRALGDGSPLVRGLAATALGHIGDPAAVAALEKALGDPDAGVRARVQDALALLRPPPPRPSARVATRVQMAPHEPPRRPTLHVVVKPMAVRAAAGQQLGDRMREMVVRGLADEPGLTVDADGGELVVDGSITRLSREANGPWIETTCEVKLTVSNAGGSLLSIVSGGATVQTARRAWSKRIEPSLQAEALDNAVLGLRANLLSLLARHGYR